MGVDETCDIDVIMCGEEIALSRIDSDGIGIASFVALKVIGVFSFREKSNCGGFFWDSLGRALVVSFKAIRDDLGFFSLTSCHCFELYPKTWGRILG